METDSPQHSTVLAFLGVLRRRLLVVVLCCVLVPTAALVYSLTRQKQYTATSSLLFDDPGATQQLINPNASQPVFDPAREAATNVGLVTQREVLDRAARQIGGGRTGSSLGGVVDVTANGLSNLVSINATATDPKLAARIANAVATQYIAFRRDAERAKLRDARQLVKGELAQLSPSQQNSSRANELRQRADELSTAAALQTGNAERVETATTPTAPSSPKPVRNTIIGVFLGILLGVAVAFLLERIDRRLRDPSEPEHIFDRPVLGAIPKSKPLGARTADDVLGQPEAEAFGMVRANLRYFDVATPIKTVLVTSAAPQDGKTTVSVNLATAAAASGAKVLLLEADLRLPTLAGSAADRHSLGVSSLLSGQATLDEIVRATPVASSRNGTPVAHLGIAFAGPPPPNPTDLIESARMTQLLRTAEEEYDLVIIDGPPSSVQDTVPLLKAVNGVIVVVRIGKTSRDAAHHLRKQLDHLKAPVLGLVLNDVPRRNTGYYGYYGYDSVREETPGALATPEERLRA